VIRSGGYEEGISRVASSVLGVICIAVGLRWLQLFIFTGYRAHLRHIMIPLGAVTIVFGLLMVLLSLRMNGPRDGIPRS
jgi:hypothetical protein